MLKKLAVPFMTLAMAAFGCSSSTTPSGTGGNGGGAAGAGGAGGAAGAAGGTGGAGGALVTDAAAELTYAVTLTGIMEFGTDGAAVLGTGSATVMLNPNTGAVSVTGTYANLTGAATSAHIHGLATPPASANIIVPLTVTSGTPPTSGTISGTGTLTAAQITGMEGGMTYINIHTAANPNGEIRGNINAAP
jgi:hypothetical protein